MLWLVIGGLTLFLFLGGLRAFERASVTTIKSLFIWLGALAGISLTLLLVLSGRGGMALGALTLFGPLIWQRWRTSHAAADASNQQQASPPPPGRQGSMTRGEAYEVLGLHPGASEAEIRAAHHRLMRAAHPDSGGSDWVATRINLARDILLGRSGSGGRRAG
jgi:DnaJ homolog subfamily C member 19